MTAALLAAAAVAWVGHACLLMAAVNHLYGRPIPKWFLKPYRHATGLGILLFPLLLLAADAASGVWSAVGFGYLGLCLVFGGLVFPVITVARLLRRTPAAVLEERAETVDFRKQLGAAAVGDGKFRWVARLPLNDVFRVDFTDLTLAPPGLPAGWDGLTIQLISDTHFYGTPGRAFFEAVFDRLAAAPPPDLLVLAGDYLDHDRYHGWVAPLFGRLTATAGRYAVLGNHDQHHDPDRVRAELTAAGYEVLGNGWREVVIRGERAVLVGHEGPWFRPPPDLSGAPPGAFRLCVSHSPDNVYWGRRNGVGLMLSGHVHGGQVRLPVVGSIFVPSVYGRRFDCGVFEGGGTVLVANRGLAGKEPLRFRCRPEVVRVTLRRGGG